MREPRPGWLRNLLRLRPELSSGTGGRVQVTAPLWERAEGCSLGGEPLAHSLPRRGSCGRETREINHASRGGGFRGLDGRWP